MALEAPAAADLAAYRSRFDRLMATASEPAWLRAAREAAMARAEGIGFPTPGDEEWRFTPVAPITRARFAEDGAVAAPGPELLGLRLGEAAAAELVFVNGRFAPQLSRTSVEGLRVLPLAAALASQPGALEPHLTRVAGPAGVFADLNAALAHDGAVVVVPAGLLVERPIHLLFLGGGSGRAAGAMAHTRTLVLAGRGSQSAIVQTWAGPDGEAYLATSVTEVVAAGGAVVDHYRLQREGLGAFHVSSVHATVDRDARFSDHALLFGGALSRNDATVRLDGAGAECVLDGLLLAGGSQHMDAHTVIDHVQPHCTSRELYNGVFDGQARGVFHGRIVVRPDAQKTSAHQANHNLLLSRQALVNSTPALEIHADDVKCKHGSTTGQLDPKALFYLRSRGVGEAEARSMLVYAFAEEVLGRVALPSVRERLQGVLARRLPGAPQELPS